MHGRNRETCSNLIFAHTATQPFHNYRTPFTQEKLHKSKRSITQRANHPTTRPPSPLKMAASYFSSLLTTTTSRVATLRQNLLPSENDGDTVQDTHLCRVLRAYYTEKGRGFPGWLPPDPKAPPPSTPVYTSNVGAGYGGGLDQSPGGSPGGNKLGALWDNQGRAGGAAQPASLRAGRSAAALRPAGQSPFTKTPSPAPQVTPRGLPSTQERSQQTAAASKQPMSAKDRFRNMAGRSTPTQSSTGSAASSYGPSAGGGDHEAPFAPPESGYGGARSGSAPPNSQKDYPVSANAPWANNEPDIGGGGYSDGAGRHPARQGLPSGPAAGRRGLPSGPRGYR